MDFEKIKLVVSDVDGTFTSNSKILLKSTYEALKIIKSKNMLFGLCSGRETLSLHNLTKKWGIEEYVDFLIGFGGAQIFDLRNKTEKYTYLLDGQIIKDIIKHYDDMDLNFAIPWEGTLYFPKMNRHVIPSATFEMMKYEIVDFDIFLNEPKFKVMLFCDETYMDKVIERSKSLVLKNFNGTPIRTGPNLFEYMNDKVSKSSGLQIYLDDNNLTFDNVCAFGDADNDYGMLKDSYIGVAMKNGSEKTKNIANYITDDNDSDGIYNFVKKYF